MPKRIFLGPHSQRLEKRDRGIPWRDQRIDGVYGTSSAEPVRRVHLLCVPLLCVPALCVFVRRVVCLCSARPHRAALVDVVDTTSLVDPGDLTCPYPFSVP